MGKGKNLNPADAHRKALRKKELKKNKAERQKTRDFALVKKDTGELEDEIAELEAVTEPSSVQKARLSELKADLAGINKKKEEYVEAHPEQRKLVYASARRREQKEREGREAENPVVKEKKRNLFNKNGLPRHPERSMYYDPVMNPFGMPPPGMPYVERGLLPGEVASEDETVEDEDDADEVVMPEGPPPGTADDRKGEDLDEDSDDDIPMPEGPPPSMLPGGMPSLPPLPQGPPPITTYPHESTLPLLPTGFNPLPGSSSLPSRPPLPLPPPPPGPPVPPFPGFASNYPPFPPNSIPPHNFPPPPPGYPINNLPPPPPGFFSHRMQTSGSMQDPLSSIPHQTFQAHRASAIESTSSLLLNPNLPSKPMTDPAAAATHTANVTVSAEPQLRDFKKESTAFLPASLKRKKHAPAGGASGKVNAAPSLNTAPVEAEGGALNAQVKPDLLGILREKFGPVPEVNQAEDVSSKKRRLEETKSKPKDDYDNFLSEMGDILRPPK